MSEVKNVLLIAHGIRTGKQNWVKEFLSFAYVWLAAKGQRVEEWKLEDCSYGWIPGSFLAVPVIGAVLRYTKIRLMMRKIGALHESHPNANFFCLAHSWGTMLMYEAIRRLDIDTDKPACKFRMFIMWGGIVDEKESFEDTIGVGKIKDVVNYYSDNDLVVKLQPLFGHCGYFGFLDLNGEPSQHPKPRVLNLDVSPDEHDDYNHNKREIYWDEAMERFLTSLK